MPYAEQHCMTVYFLQIQPPDSDGPESERFWDDKRWKWIVVDLTIHKYVESEGFFPNLKDAQKDAELFMQELRNGEQVFDEDAPPIYTGFSLN